MNVYQVTKDFGKKALLVGGLVAILGGCNSKPRVIQILSDVNGDGKKDIIEYIFDGSVGLAGSHDIYVTLNSKNSFEESKKVLHLKSRPSNLNAEDLNGDNNLDLTYVLRDGSVGLAGSLDMYFAKGNGDGTFQDPIKIKHY